MRHEHRRVGRSCSSVLTGLVVIAIACGPWTAHDALAARIFVDEGKRDVQFHPIDGKGTYQRIVFVTGATREQVVRALRGPATGKDGFAPHMVSSTPVDQQFHGTWVQAENMRIAGLPEALGATVTGQFTDDGMVAKMRNGITYGDFRIDVSPERTLSDGDIEVRVTESGWFSVMKEKPSSLLGLPGYLMSNLTPIGWFMQGVGGTAVSRAHLDLFALADVLRARLAATSSH